MAVGTEQAQIVEAVVVPVAVDVVYFERDGLREPFGEVAACTLCLKNPLPNKAIAQMKRTYIGRVFN